MNKFGRVNLITTILVVFSMTSLVHANNYHHDNSRGVVPGKSLVHGVQIVDENSATGFSLPVLGETDEDAVLYNIPADDSASVPLREVPTLYLTNGPAPVVIDESISADNLMRGLVYPGAPNPITYGDWIDVGESTLKFRILPNGTSKVFMRVRGLLPNSLYTVWQFNKMPGPPGPFAGIPNVLATDHRGNATMKRILPFNIRETVKSLDLIYHSDHQVYGGTPSLISIFAGHDQHVQLQFNMNDEQ